MCGLAGFVGKGDKNDLIRMTRVLTHRGPDNEGYYNDEKKHVNLGHRRLSIIDIAGGRQPMSTADEKLWIVFNGEIYNFRELRAELEQKGHIFRSHHSDTEVLLYAYREWGNDFVNRLNGMWAFVIYDIEKQVIFCSRDRFGKKPFFYSLQNGNFVFGSELSALRCHPSLQFDISSIALQKYFAYGYIPGPHTIYNAVAKLKGGHSLVFSIPDGTIRIHEYWKFRIEPNIQSRRTDEDYAEELRSLLDRAVRRRLISDVPLGVFLSGGIDSSLIAAFATRALGDTELKTFCIGFAESSFDERHFASMIADIFHTRHFTYEFDLDESLRNIHDIIEKLDEPMGDSSLLPTYMLCKQTRREVTVALSGDGGDEIFAGYDPYKALAYAQWYQRLVPRPLHTAIRLIASRLPVSFGNISTDFKIKKTLQGLSYSSRLWLPVWMGTIEPKEFPECFDKAFSEEEIYSEAIDLWDGSKGKHVCDRTLEFFTNLYLQDDILVKVDRAGMMNSLEVRSPLLDVEIAEFARSLPHTLKFRNGRTKYILKKALEPCLPEEIIYRKKKGFGIPIADWFYRNQKAIDPAIMPAPMKQAFVQEKMKLHSEKRGDNRLFLWNTYLLSQWLQGRSA
ncbi:MAG: asparagine synthase (glutamine-hydrolyzing) [Spirochaetota bacterium]